MINDVKSRKRDEKKMDGSELDAKFANARLMFLHSHSLLTHPNNNRKETPANSLSRLVNKAEKTA